MFQHGTLSAPRRYDFVLLMDRSYLLRIFVCTKVFCRMETTSLQKSIYSKDLCYKRFGKVSGFVH